MIGNRPCHNLATVQKLQSLLVASTVLCLVVGVVPLATNFASADDVFFERPDDSADYYGILDSVNVEAGIGTGGPSFFGRHNLTSVPFDFDVVGQDMMMQLDAIGNQRSFWAWQPDERMPPEPLVTVSDDRLSHGDIFIWVGSDGIWGAWDAQPVSAKFRFVHVADAHISDDDVTDLLPGDANQDLSFDQLDLVAVLQAGKYLTGDPATWGEGDWNVAPGGSQGDPPLGDGVFDQVDIIAALSSGRYLAGPYAALYANGQRTDAQSPDDAAAIGSLRGAVGLEQPDPAYVPVPEPSAVVLVVLGLFGVVAASRRR